jgi:hypothetical protein
LYYYDLQFVKPFRNWGLENKLDEDRAQVYQQLEIKSEVDNILTIKKQAPIALANFKAYFNVILKFREQKKNILKIITPEDLQSLSQYKIPKQESKVSDNDKLATEE